MILTGWRQRQPVFYCASQGVQHKTYPSFIYTNNFIMKILSTQFNFKQVLAQAALGLSLSVLSSAVWSATPPNTPITNTATASYAVAGVALTTPGSVAVNTAACIAVGIKVDLLQYVAPARAAFAPLATNQVVSATSGSASGALTGPFTPLAARVLLNAPAATALPANLLLTPLVNAAGQSISAFSRNEPVFVRVTSFDANINAALADTVVVTVTTTGGDSEVLQLTETGASTGVFTGVINTNITAPIKNDGKLSYATRNEQFTATYTHSNCTTGALIAASSSALIDPYGIVFDSKTGAPLNGATITLLNALTGLPATVFCDDGVTVLPQPIVSGAPTVCDATPLVGGYRFPQVAAGSYKLTVTPPLGHTFSSVVAPAQLPATVGIPATPPAILGNPGALTPGGSYGGVFTLFGPALKVDIPLDAGGAVLSLQKTAGKAVIATGEFMPYTITITNANLAPANNVQILDRLPAGFRYQKGSTTLNGVPQADPAISSDGQSLTFTLASVAGAGASTLKYVALVTVAARVGIADNTAVAVGNFVSNTAHASVTVREDLFRNKTILLGRVIDGSCDDKVDNDLKGLANARILLQDGTYVLTDKEGRWHIDNLRAGTQVVQLDLDSLPKNYEMMECEKNTRFAGRSYSQFVNLQGGTMWRANFHVQKKAPLALRVTQTLGAQRGTDKTEVSLAVLSSTEVTGYSATIILPAGTKLVSGSSTLNGEKIADPEVANQALTFRSTARPAHWQDQYTFAVTEVSDPASFKSLLRFTPPGRPAQNAPLAQVTVSGDQAVSNGTYAEVLVEADELKPAKTEEDDNVNNLLEKLPYDEKWLATAQPSAEWLHPQADFHPNLSSMSVVVKHAPGQSVSLKVNGVAVDPLKFDGVKMNAARTVALSSWRGVMVEEGKNIFEVNIVNADGSVALHSVRDIYYSSTPDHVEFLPNLSRLIADGKTRPVIAVRILDKLGVPVRRGINGEFNLNEPYRSYDRRAATDRQPLTGSIAGKAHFEVKADGIALIELEPTTQTGDAILNFQFADKRIQELRAWLEPNQRDWVLVGFGEGTLGQKTLSGNMTALQASGDDKQLFDSNKLAFYAKGSIKGEYLVTAAYDTAKKLNPAQVKQAIDPTAYYTLYADATQARFDAATASRLYVKVERKKFYAMFGDYDTGLSVTELSRYSRTMNGIKSEYKGDTLAYNGFASVTAQAFVKDEIPGNGTSGIYKISRNNILLNSDKVRIETRDRFQSQIIVSTQSLTRYLDYDIDYAVGTLTFRDPIQARDAAFNPVYIVAEYESSDTIDQRATLGGRASVKPLQALEVGTTLIHEGTVGAAGNLQGVDATYKWDEQTKLRTELAGTNRTLAGQAKSGSAWLGELTHHEADWDAKGYVRQQGGTFGMGQQAASEIATRKIGADGRLKLSDSTSLQGTTYQQSNLLNGAKTSLVEARVENHITEALSAYYGGRDARDTSNLGTKRSDQFIAGTAYTLLDKKLTLRAGAEVGSGTAGSVMMPDRLILGSDYRVSNQSKVFAEQEFAKGEKLNVQTTRVGVRTQAWTGAEMSASVADNFTNDAERLYTNMGLVQRWQINENWQTDFAIDRTKTLKNTAPAPINLNTPLPSGSGGVVGLPAMTGDYTSESAGVAYHENVWSANGKVELRNSSLSQQKNLLLGTQRSLDEGRIMGLSFAMRNATTGATIANSSDLRASYASRPNDSEWVWLNRTDYITQFSQTGINSQKGKKLVDNSNWNWMPNNHTQISLQYGAKYVLDNIDGMDYKGYTDLMGVEGRYDITQDWDIGSFATMMRSVSVGVRTYAIGASVGYHLMDNMWLAGGYNMRGMNDRDFANASYRAKGPYITLRMKIDQDTLGLNDNKGKTRPLAAE